MAKVKLLFTAYPNSFKVIVENLEDLSIVQIQEIERFVSQRKGLFDFETYSFVIQKRLAFREFQLLIQSSKIDALCRERVLRQKVQPRVGFGEYKGMFYSELPDSYIAWLYSNYRGSQRAIIESEYKKRAL